MSDIFDNNGFDGLKLNIGSQSLIEMEEELNLSVNEIEITEETNQEIPAQLSLFKIAPWGDDFRALPNDYARSALFTVRHPNTKREAFESELIFTLSNDVKITYTGIELRAIDDELVWQQVLDYAKEFTAGEPVEFSLYQICKDIGWATNGTYYKKVVACLTRLQATAMQFESPKIGFIESLSLIHRFRIVPSTNKKKICRVSIDSEMLKLFAGSYYTKVVWDSYKTLKPISRRMFDYFASHKKPQPLSVDRFQSLCGSTSLPKSWKTNVKESLGELKEKGLIKDGWIENNKIHCER